MALTTTLLVLAIAGAGAYLSLALGPTALAAVSGDVNCDETTNSIDALGVLRSIAGLSTPACNDAADVNCDDAVTAIDSLFILRFVAGLPVNLPGACPPIGTAAGLPLLNEVLFLPALAEFQFVELKNGGAGAASLDGLSLVDEWNQTYVLPAGLPALGSDEVLLIVFDGGSSVAGNVVHASPAGFLDSESGSVELRDGADVLDHVAWGEGQPDRVNLTHGGVELGLGPGTAIARHPASVGLGRLEWLPAAAGAATPGEPNPAPGMGPMLPLDGALVGGDAALRWYPVPGATSYRVQVSADATFTAPLVDETVAVAAFDPGPLAPGEYHWRVVPLTETYDGKGGTLTLAMKDASVANEAGLSTPVSGEWRVNFVDNYRRGKPDYTVNGKIAPEVTSFGYLTVSKAGGSPGLRYITLLIDRSGKQSALYGAELADGVRGLSSSEFRTRLQAETGAEALAVPPDFPKSAAR